MFSYNEYGNLIKIISNHLPIIDFKDVEENTKKFCVLRHDIEFSIDRAYNLAKIENKLGVISTYTVQVRNNTYNALSEKNIKAIKEIKKLGHKIGLHQNPPPMSESELTNYILKDIETLEHYYGFEVDRFAFHRCGGSPHLLKSYIQVDNKINCYDKKFFHYFEGGKPEELKVNYIADSNHRWKYGHPLDLDFRKIKKLQLLTHPYSWTNRGIQDNYANYLSLIKERTEELVFSMNTETNTFPNEILETLK